MSRKSARFIAQDLVDFSTSDVYECWNDMGVVAKDKVGDWTVTDYGESVGGKMSRSNYQQVPTFDDTIIDMMIDFCNKRR